MEAGVRIVWSVAHITLLPVSRHPDPGRGDPAPGITSNGHLGPRQGGQGGCQVPRLGNCPFPVYLPKLRHQLNQTKYLRLNISSRPEPSTAQIAHVVMKSSGNLSGHFMLFYDV